MAKLPYRCKAFTLIEVLIALMIIAIALTAVIRASSRDIDDQYLLQQKTYGLWVAEYILNQQQLKLPLKSKITMFDQQWHWREQTQTDTITILIHDEKGQLVTQLTGVRNER